MNQQMIDKLVDSYEFPEKEKTEVHMLISKIEVIKAGYYDAWMHGVEMIIANMILHLRDESILVRVAAGRVLINALKADDFSYVLEVVTSYERKHNQQIRIESSIMNQVNNILNNKAA